MKQSVKEYFETVSGELYEQFSALFAEMPVSYTIDGVSFPQPKDMKYGQMLSLRSELGGTNDYEAALVVGRVMANCDASELPVMEFMPYVIQVLALVENSIKQEQKHLDYKPEKDEISAGIDKLSQFKEWGVIDTIAQRMHILHDAVTELRYNDVFLMLWKDLEQSKFEKRLMKIKNA